MVEDENLCIADYRIIFHVTGLWLAFGRMALDCQMVTGLGIVRFYDLLRACGT